jgi:hypothetical protein
VDRRPEQGRQDLVAFMQTLTGPETRIAGPNPMTALTAAWRACTKAAAGGSPARAMRRPHPPESLRDRTRPEFWSGAIITSTLWVILFIYAATQGFGR